MVIDAASTTFMLASTALVQLMTPGLAFFYGGLVSDSSVLAMMMQVLVCMGVGSIFWYLVLFSLCFGDSWGIFGSPATYGLLLGVNVNEPLMKDGSIYVDQIPGLLFVAYQGMFAVITPALMTGAFADRFRFKPFIIFLVFWLLFVYAPCCHWLWGGGWIAQMGAVDFAGGIVVHVSAGFSALATLLVVGRRQEDSCTPPHNVPFVALGTALLWFGWFGFNGGSALAMGRTAVAAAVNTEIAASVALFLWLIIDWLHNGRPGLVGLCVGAIAGLATVTPAAGFIQPWGALVLGVIAAGSCYACCEFIRALGFDDALDVWAVHGMGGLIGTVMLGVLADPSVCGADPEVEAVPSWCVNPNTVTRSWRQLGVQVAAAVACAAYSFVVTYVMLKAINIVVPIVPHPDGLTNGLDLLEHGQQAYTGPKAYGQQKNTPERQNSEEPSTASPEPDGAAGVDA
mmetsp:Transcript_121639/g.295202  ORF Transcript_121639/g.295202 Transcript_121639/m.295202 type:complete len:456 (+) Transcript_121639:106-1473(+)